MYSFPPPPPLLRISKKPPGQEDKRLFCLFSPKEYHAPPASLPLVRCVHKHYTLARVHGEAVSDWLCLPCQSYFFPNRVGGRWRGRIQQFTGRCLSSTSRSAKQARGGRGAGRGKTACRPYQQTAHFCFCKPNDDLAVRGKLV